MSVQVSYKKQGIFFIMLLLIALVTVEGVARAYEFYKPPNCVLLESDVFKNVDPVLARQICWDNSQIIYEENGILQLKPNQHFSTININSFGFRGDEITIEKSNEIIRIFMVGGSTTFGAGATSDDNTIPVLLQQKLEKSNPMKNIEVINAGIPFADSFRETYLIKNKILQFQPDIIIIYDGWNDAHHKKVYDNVLGKSENQEENIFKFKNFPFYRTPFVINTILEQNSSEIEDKDVDKNQIIKNWKNHMLDLCETNNQKEIKTFVIVQPLIGTGNKILTSSETKFLNQSNSNTIDIMYGLSKEVKTLSFMCTDTADFTDVFDDVNVPIFTDQGHMSDLGNEIIAEKIANIVNPNL